MPEKRTIERARRAKRQGKAPTSQAGEFVREEIRHLREGRHGARSTRQAIAIGLSKARRAGVALPPRGRQAPARGGRSIEAPRPSSRRRSRAVVSALRREGRSAASTRALARQARGSARRRGRASLRAAARKAVATKGPFIRRRIARKAAATRRG